MDEQPTGQTGPLPAVVASTETTGPQKAVSEPPSHLHRVSLWRPHISRREGIFMAIYAGTVLVLGLLAGLVWSLVTPLPSVTVTSDGTATTTNSAAVQSFSPDAAFIMIGLVTGLILGIIAWQWFHRAGWPVILIAGLGASLCALIAVHFGAVIGPDDFDTRLASASAGETVVLDLALTTSTAWVVWPFAAIVPILVYSALTRDSETPRSRGRRAERSSGWAEEGQTGSGHRILRFAHGQRVVVPTPDEPAAEEDEPGSG